MARPISLGWTVEQDARDQVDRMAHRANVSSAVFFERMVEHVETELTAQGIPSWWPAGPAFVDGELLINTE